MTTSTVSSLNSLFEDIYEDAMFVARERALMPGLVTNYTAMGMQTRYAGIYPTLTAQEVAEGTDYANATEWTKTSKMTVTPANVMVQVILTDQRIETDPDDARRDAANEMGYAIAKKIDQDLLGKFDDLDAGVGASGSAASIAYCSAALSKLRASNATGRAAIVLHPYQWYNIWTELGQPSSNQAFLGDVANEALREHFVGNWLGVDWYQTSNVSIDSSSDAYGAAFVPEALALDTRRAMQLEPERDASKLAWELNMSAWYGVAVRRGEFGQYIYTSAGTPTGT
jgi:hypothetical protein